MSEHKAPYLHVVRATPSNDAQSIETWDEGIKPSSVTDHQPASSGGVETPDTTADKETTPADTTNLPLNQPLTQAIMFLAVGWVALCVERTVHAVDIQQVARRQYEVSVHYADEHGQEAVGAGIILRVELEVKQGLIVQSTVEPVKP